MSSPLPRKVVVLPNMIQLTWTWTHSWPTPDRGDGIPPEGLNTWAGPACKTRIRERVSEKLRCEVDQTQLTANPEALILLSSTPIPCSRNRTVAIDYQNRRENLKGSGIPPDIFIIVWCNWT